MTTETIKDQISGEMLQVTRIGSNGESGDKQLVHYRTDDGVDVVVTNGNQLWEDDDGFAEAKAKCDEI